MNLRFFLYLAVSGSILAFLLVCPAIFPLWQGGSNQAFLSYNAVRGMAIERQGLLYTLNFEQQNQVVAAINNGNEIPFEKVVIYRFDGPEWIIRK